MFVSSSILKHAWHPGCRTIQFETHSRKQNASKCEHVTQRNLHLW